jgi:hypothetical protein
MVVTILFDSYRTVRGWSAEEDRSRQRVREAESALESALRTEALPPPHDLDRIHASLRQLLQEGVPHLNDEELETAPPPPPSADTDDGDHVSSVRSAVGDLALPELWKVTHARLGEYHGTAVGQAKRAFRNAQYAMGAGFVLLGVFVYAAFHAKSATASATAGALGAVAAALSGYIARTFIKSQEMTSAALHRYFEEPLVLSRYLAAERLVRDVGLSEEHRTELLRTIVQSMIVGEPARRTTAVPDANAAEEQ